VQYYLPAAGGAGELVYAPRVAGFAEVTLSDRGRSAERVLTFRLLAGAPEPGRSLDWAGAEAIPDALNSAPTPGQGATWQDVPATLNDPRKLKGLERSLLKHVYESAELALYQNRSLGLVSEPDEEPEAFARRCKEVARRRAEPEVEKLRAEHQPALDELSAKHGSGSPKVDEARARWHAALERVRRDWDKKAQDVKDLLLRPRKADIRVTHFGIGWAPLRRDEGGKLVPAYKRSAGA
jgi:hypothetical protein